MQADVFNRDQDNINFGHGGLNTSFIERELSDFHNFLEQHFPYDHPEEGSQLYWKTGVEDRWRRGHLT